RSAGGSAVDPSGGPPFFSLIMNVRSGRESPRPRPRPWHRLLHGESALSITLTRNGLMNRYACLVEPGRVELRHIPVPRPGPGEVLRRIARGLAGGTDRRAYVRGHPLVPMPGPFGHRYAGTVVGLGEGASRFEVGQPVMGVHSAPCGDCDLCAGER